MLIRRRAVLSTRVDPSTSQVRRRSVASRSKSRFRATVAACERLLTGNRRQMRHRARPRSRSSALCGRRLRSARRQRRWSFCLRSLSSPQAAGIRAPTEGCELVRRPRSRPRRARSGCRGGRKMFAYPPHSRRRRPDLFSLAHCPRFISSRSPDRRSPDSGGPARPRAVSGGSRRLWPHAPTRGARRQRNCSRSSLAGSLPPRWPCPDRRGRLGPTSVLPGRTRTRQTLAPATGAVEVG